MLSFRKLENSNQTHYVIVNPSIRCTIVSMHAAHVKTHTHILKCTRAQHMMHPFKRKKKKQISNQTINENTAKQNKKQTIPCTERVFLARTITWVHRHQCQLPAIICKVAAIWAQHITYIISHRNTINRTILAAQWHHNCCILCNSIHNRTNITISIC